MRDSWPEQISTKEILRIAVIAELDAINLYEQLASQTKDKNIKKIFLDIAREEKTHVGEFQTMLLRLDDEQTTGCTFLRNRSSA